MRERDQLLGAIAQAQWAISRAKVDERYPAAMKAWVVREQEKVIQRHKETLSQMGKDQ